MANPLANETGFCWELLMLGRRHAAGRGLLGEDREDCAVEFALHVLTLLHAAAREEALAAVAGAQDPAWLHRQARAHVRNFQRVVLTHARRCHSLVPLYTPEGGKEPVSRVEGGETALLRAEFWQHIFVALDSLDPIPRQLLIGHQMQGESIEALADSCGRSCHAVEQTLLRARRQMHRVLERRGCGETALREYVAAFVPDHAPVMSNLRTVGRDQNKC